MNSKPILAKLCLLLAVSSASVSAKSPATFGGSEFTGQFSTSLVANTERSERVIFKSTPAENYKSIAGVKDDSEVALGRLYSPQAGNTSITVILVENRDEDPFGYVDANEDRKFTPDEKIVFQQEEKDNPYMWNATINLPVKNNYFTQSAMFLQYFKRVRTDKMQPGDRLLAQSTEVFAGGTVDIRGKKIWVQYAYDFSDKKIDPQNGWLGIDSNGDGKVDMHSLSSEAAKASKETIVFRVGDGYFSTSKADVAKNQIVLRENAAKDYKRIELEIGKEIPDFEFTDLDGKKHKFSEFRGKYVLVDFWGLWCPPCREEMPYLREAYKRYKNRNFEILGMNTDPNPPAEIKEVLTKSQLPWTQAKLDSISDFVNVKLRIESFPTTFLVSPEGKLLSMSRNGRDDLDLRGEELFDSLDKTLPR